VERARRLQQWLHWLILALSVCVLTVQLTMAAAYGQSSPHDLPTPGQVLAQDTLPDDAVVPPPISAPVILDGRPIFSVANTQQVTSVERATYVSKELADLVQRQTVFRVNWVRRDDVPVILVNGGYLMTVTQADADLAEVNSAVDLARDWTDLIRVELRQAQTERSQSVLVRRSGIALGVLLLAIALHRAMGFLWRRSLRPALEHMAVLDGSEADPPGTPTGLNLLLNLLLLLARGACGLVPVSILRTCFLSPAAAAIFCGSRLGRAW
jgi:hypothetical protein